MDPMTQEPWLSSRSLPGVNMRTSTYKTEFLVVTCQCIMHKLHIRVFLRMYVPTETYILHHMICDIIIAYVYNSTIVS